MARIVRIGRLKRGIQAITACGEDVFVKLVDSSTSFRDKVTGWVIKGGEVKPLPKGTLSPSLVKAVNAGRFVRVKTEKSKKSKGEDLVEYIITRNEEMEKGKGQKKDDE